MLRHFSTWRRVITGEEIVSFFRIKRGARKLLPIAISAQTDTVM